jgi:signal peptidase I
MDLPVTPHETVSDAARTRAAELLGADLPPLEAVRAPEPPSAAPAQPSSPGRPLISTVTLLQTVGLALVTYVSLFHLSVVRGSSMAPSIHDGDRILIDPLSYLFAEIERGDIVVLQYPLDPSVDYIKRVVGLPGDEIAIEAGTVWVNGEPLAEPYVLGPDPSTSLRAEVLPAHYFVLGDNRARSCDSREFGQVPQGYVRGKVELRIWPPDRAGRIDG